MYRAFCQGEFKGTFERYPSKVDPYYPVYVVYLPKNAWSVLMAYVPRAIPLTSVPKEYLVLNLLLQGVA